MGHPTRAGAPYESRMFELFLLVPRSAWECIPFLPMREWIGDSDEFVFRLEICANDLVVARKHGVIQVMPDDHHQIMASQWAV